MASEIAPSLLLVFAAFLYQGVVSQDWKLALVTSLFKKGAENNHQITDQFPSLVL